MSEKEFSGTLKILCPKIIEIIIINDKITHEEAIKRFYFSKTYALLEKEETKMWHFSPLAIYDIFSNEVSGKKVEIPKV
jgi:hypothetical protein